MATTASISTATTQGGSGAAMFLGALLDGLPEAFILGVGIALGGGISVAFVVAVFVSNVPQGTAGHAHLAPGRDVGPDDRRDVGLVDGGLRASPPPSATCSPTRSPTTASTPRRSPPVRSS